MRRSSKNLPADLRKLSPHALESSTENSEAAESKLINLAISSYLASIGRKGGLKGGKARSEALSKARKSEIARDAANSRWGNRDKR